MDNNTLYLIELENKFIEKNIHFEKLHIISINQHFNDLCMQDLTTLQGRITAIKTIFSYNYNPPIYINNDLIFFKVKDKNTFWINGALIEDIKNKNNKCLIIFKGGFYLDLNKNYRTIMSNWLKIKEIINYKNGFI